MSNTQFQPHSWNEKEGGLPLSIQELTEQPSFETTEPESTFDFDELLEKVETSASDNTLSTEPLITENSDSGEGLSEEDEIKAAAYAQGVIDGRAQEKNAQNEDLSSASLRINQLAELVKKKDIELNSELEFAVLNFIKNTAYAIFDDLITSEAARLIEKKTRDFIKDNDLLDFTTVVQVSEHDLELINNLDNSSVKFNANKNLSSGQARLVAKPKTLTQGGSLSAELDVRDMLDEQLKEVTNA